MRKRISIVIVMGLIILSLVAVVAKTNTQVELHQLDLRTKQQEIEIQKAKQLQLEQEVKDAKGDKKKLEEAERKLKEQQAEIERLQAIKAEKARIAQEQAQNAVVASAESPQPTPQAVSGDWVAQCHTWASQAGIVLTNSAITLLDRESDCNPHAQNPTSSACGIPQDINGCTVGYDPIAQLIWFHNYCMSRYGSFDEALAHSTAVGWY